MDMRRTEDWLRQAKKDLGHARRSLDMEDYEWSCFSAQQSAEKAVKALYESLGAHVLGHSVSTLLQKLPKQERPDAALVNAAKLLDRHYIPTRYTNSHPKDPYGLLYEAGRSRSRTDCRKDPTVL